MGWEFTMDAKVVLSLLLLSHIVTDFMWQDNAIAEGKKICFRTMLKHIKHYLVVNVVLLSAYLNSDNNLWWVIIVLSLAHLAIDKCKVEYDKKKKNKGFESFLVDQIAHFILIGACYLFIKDIHINPLADTIGSFIGSNYPIFVHLTKQNAFIGIVIMAGYIFNFKGATYITKKVLVKYLPSKDNDKYMIKEEDGIKNAGEAIGNLERILILTLVLQQNYLTIGVVLAGKTLARYKKLDEKNFAEYFLIGSFTSIIVVFLTGAFIKAVINL